ncbi:hypothetical protein ACQ4PT_014999 [Festuca glaucescens]
MATKEKGAVQGPVEEANANKHKELTDAGCSSAQPADGGATVKTGGVAVQAYGYPSRRPGKELLQELGTDAEKTAMIVKLNKAKGAARARLMVVGVFLSMMLITSKQLIDSMKKIWKIRGHVYTSQLADRRFVLEFTEEGDFNHVSKGGSWRFKDDAVLIRVLKEGEELEKVTFTTVPIWAQFWDIPFYLLSKELARDLGSKIGELICIDNDARGDICNKIIRARVHMPVDVAIRRWIPLVDEFTDEDVVVSVFYERLPSFCHYCGIIGHKKERCTTAKEERIEGYNKDLGLGPTLKEDLRKWFLPEIIGQDQQLHPHVLPWRLQRDQIFGTGSASAMKQKVLVEHVAKQVNQLTVEDQGDVRNMEDKEANNKPASPDSLVSSFQLLVGNDPDPVAQSGESKMMNVAVISAPVEQKTNVEGKKQGLQITPPVKKGSWRRTPRKGEQGKHIHGDTLTTQDMILGATRPCQILEEEYEDMQPANKRMFHVPTLDECLGAENLRRMREEEADAFIAGVCAAKEPIKGNVKSLDVVTNPQVAPHLFSLEVCHNGFFCGLAEKLQYVDDTVSIFDNLLIDSWSSSTLDHILCVLDCMRDEKVHVYWLCPGKELFDGLLPLVTDANLIDMRREAQVHKTLVIFVDHTNFIRLIRADLVRARAAIARVETVVGVQSALSEGVASTSIVVAQDVGQECVQSQGNDSDSDSSTDSEFFDSDYDAESGDDDFFLDNVDTDLHDNNERVFIANIEDDSQLEDKDLNLEEGERLMLRYKFQAFNPAVDMNSPVFKIGMKFVSIEEARQAVNAYSIRERVNTRKTKNDKTRLHAICEEGCPWRLKIGFDLQRSGGYVVTSYEGNHTCERVYEMRTLTSKLLCRQFIDEFRDNQKMDLQSFAAKVQRKYNMCPDRWKLGRARKAALLEIHGNEEAQFALLRDYGEELKRANPGSTFFLSTNSVKESGTDIVKEHLATMYWSYDACKRGFLSVCMPLICVDGCHIKTRYKGVLLTTVGIDPNDCIFPIAMGMVEVECTSSWEWFLTTLRDDLNITNTSRWTIMSDRQKGLINAVEKVIEERH